MCDPKHPPILRNKNYKHPSVFTPENLLREAKRQKNIADHKVPRICLLDPDGDIVQNLRAEKKARINPHWACYHTKMYIFQYGEIEFGIIGYAVGSSFSVLVAEELFASGCQLLISMSSAGQIVKKRKPPYFILIEKALRDEGTSYHYLPPSDYSELNRELRDMLSATFIHFSLPIEQGVCWTTDAPFRETASSIEHFRSLGILAVEMEAAALYAFAEARKKSVICFAHVTNQMGSIEGDFEKGPANGGNNAIQLIYAAAKAWMDWKPK
jgi:uridine phosphorylase